MKNNILTLAIAGIAILFVVALALYGVSALMPGTSQKATPTPAGGQATAMPPADQPVAGVENVKTAFGSLSLASADQTVRDWLADKTNVYVASITSDFCAAGESDQWTVTYASDKGQYIVFVAGGAILQALDAQSTLQQGIDPRTVLDSDQVWQVVADDIAASGGQVPESASMKLALIGGTPCWDVSYQAPDGFRIVRIDAASGTISQRAVLD